MRGHHRQAEPAGKRHRAREQRLAVRLAGALQLDVIAAREKLRPAPRDPLGVLGMVRKERRGELAAEEPGKRDQAVAAGLEPAWRDERPAAMLVREPGAREQFA